MTIPPSDYSRIKSENIDLHKELTVINKANCILKHEKTVEDSLFQLCQILPSAMKYMANAEAKIIFGDQEFTTENFKNSSWSLEEEFITIDQLKGKVIISYQKEFPNDWIGPFSRTEKYLVSNIASMLAGFLNSLKGRELLNRNKRRQGIKIPVKKSVDRDLPQKDSRLLQSFLNRHARERDLFHDLMPFKVREVLLISSLYDAYVIEKEGRFSEHMMGRFPSDNLNSLPRITGVSNIEEAFEQLDSRHFDMIIIMVGLDKETPVELKHKIRKEYPYIPIFFLLNDSRDLAHFQKEDLNMFPTDRIFVWTGDYKIFFAMIKLVEDAQNIENDTQEGDVRVILMVEDSAEYYSKYLPILYKIVMDQTRRILEDIDSDQILKILRMKARPKIILAEDYQEAIRILDKYRDNMLCLISDVKFKRNGVIDPQAGFDLVAFAKKNIHNLPTIIQSSDRANLKKAYDLNSTYIDKNSETLLLDFQNFIVHYLGFGDFVFRDEMNTEIFRARNLKEFERGILEVPINSINYHAKQDHLSLWLMARGELEAASKIRPLNVGDYEEPEEHRQVILQILNASRVHKYSGRVMPFNINSMDDLTVVSRLARGTFGGKGRGLAFINNLINNFRIDEIIPEINICQPKTHVIGSYEYEFFMDRNQFDDFVVLESDYEKIKKVFLDGRLSKSLFRQLRLLISNTNCPIAVRSSGLFEDSINQPFSGVFDTFILPNSHPIREERLNQLCDAIRLVYASVFSAKAKSYIEAVGHKVVEEKMSVVIQELVGQQYGDYFFPHISGVAQSFSYYSLPGMNHDDGMTSCALGLGKYIVDGGNVFRFSPGSPSKEIIPEKQMVEQTQKTFLAVDLKNTIPDLLQGEASSLKELSLDQLQDIGVFKDCFSVWDSKSRKMIPGMKSEGTKVVNFRNILHYKSVPLCKTLKVLLDVFEDAIGAPVEIEYAIDLNRDSKYKTTFYLLQMKPLIGEKGSERVQIEEMEKKNVLMYSDHIMG
ncbi:MAG: PEP/pyruvate-binding domain-containing protein, partial [Bacteroidales bacterium]